MKKPTWVIDKERAKRAAAAETVWLFGLHAVRDALLEHIDRLRSLLAAEGIELGQASVGSDSGGRGRPDSDRWPESPSDAEAEPDGVQPMQLARAAVDLWA